LRKSEDRGHVSYEWLNAYHSFSFDIYFDPERRDSVRSGLAPYPDATCLLAGAELSHFDAVNQCLVGLQKPAKLAFFAAWRQ